MRACRGTKDGSHEGTKKNTWQASEELNMENIINRLLEDFERGKMTRRQLVKSLALTATAASAAGVAPLAAAEGGKGFTAVAVNHISYQVKDYTKTRDWYVGLLGMKVSG